MPMTPRSPLKSAMKVPGTARSFANPLSPTFREEQILEAREKSTDKDQARDLVGALQGYDTWCRKLTAVAENQNASPTG